MVVLATAAAAVTVDEGRCRSPHRLGMTAGIRCGPAPSAVMPIETIGAGAGTRTAGCGYRILVGGRDLTVMMIFLVVRPQPWAVEALARNIMEGSGSKVSLGLEHGSSLTAHANLSLVIVVKRAQSTSHMRCHHPRFASTKLMLMMRCRYPRLRSHPTTLRRPSN